MTEVAAPGDARLVRAARGAVAAVQTALRVLEGESVRLRAMALTSQAATYWVGLTLGPLLLAGSIMVGHSTPPVRRSGPSSRRTS